MENARKIIGRPFQKGNPGGPGRPPRATEAAYLDATVQAVPLEKWRKVVSIALQQALRGNHKAREWLGRYLLPQKPVTTAATPEETQQALQNFIRRMRESVNGGIA